MSGRAGYDFSDRKIQPAAMRIMARLNNEIAILIFSSLMT
jgi:hypothetical protein